MDEITRECKTCHLIKALTDFNKGNAKYGRKSECKICQNKRHSAYKKKPEIRKKYNEWVNNKNRSLPRYEKTIRYLKRKDYVKSWQEKNPDRYRALEKAKSHRRRDIKKSLVRLCASSIVYLESKNINQFSSCDFTCEYCKSIISESYHLDHIVPISREGTNDLTNLAITCKKCNCSKSAYLLEEWRPDLSGFVEQRNKLWKTQI